MMEDQQRSILTNGDYEQIPEQIGTTNIFDNNFRNSMEVIIAECIGVIPKNYFVNQFFFQMQKNVFFV